jgi:hypothetical protein
MRDAVSGEEKTKNILFLFFVAKPSPNPLPEGEA